MQLEHRFTVPAPVEEAWHVLLDVEKVAPCLPGATLDSVQEGEYAGRVKVKVGPIQLTYSGKGRFTEIDETAHRAVLTGSGRETRGPGTARATVTMVLRGDGDATDVQVLTDLVVTGRPAQFGRGVMADVGEKLIGRFADCLAHLVATQEAEPASDGQAAPVSAARPARAAAADQLLAGAPAAAAVTVPPTDRRTAVADAPRFGAESAPIDLLEVAGVPVLKRLAPLLAGLAAVFVLWAAFRRRRG